jgi:tRNA-splicing ligase RtcB
MCAVKTGLQDMGKDAVKRIAGQIKQRIPVGFEWHKKARDTSSMPQRQADVPMPVVEREFQKARHQLGTLGGGNHFIEIQRGSDGHIWVMIHSGSRNIGKQVADHYNRLAVKLNAQSGAGLPKSWQLAYLPTDTAEAEKYRREMEYCVEFALANRRAMMEQVKGIIEELFPGTTYEPMINIAHNYAASERHFGAEVIVHRKGATQAMEGQLGIIPGSQGTRSYIVRGKGNLESFMSCSHGAGRRMGRKQAIRQLDLAREKARLDARGIIHSIHKARDLDEAPSAYKDIDQVMENQRDLVDIVVELNPLAVIKG